MKKRCFLLTLIFSIMLFAAACGQKDCKAEGCSEEVFKNGYCEAHYYEKMIEEGLKELGDMFK